MAIYKQPKALQRSCWLIEEEVSGEEDALTSVRTNGRELTKAAFEAATNEERTTGRRANIYWKFARARCEGEGSARSVAGRWPSLAEGEDCGFTSFPAFTC